MEEVLQDCQFLEPPDPVDLLPSPKLQRTTVKKKGGQAVSSGLPKATPNKFSVSRLVLKHICMWAGGPFPLFH